MSDPIDEVRGKRVLVKFEAKKCIHSRNCVLDRPDVFVPNVAGEWIHPDAATPDEVAALAHNCPSGAIRYERLDGGEQEKAPLVNTVRVRENGPLAVHADLRIDGQEPRLRATLCRCGASKNKPFCDGSHVAAGFVATGETPAQDLTPLAQRDGELRVIPTKDGPLLVKGNVEVVTGTGRSVFRTQKVAFCRCGESANKPYCDGSHQRARFTSE